MAKQRGLGKGLEALLSSSNINQLANTKNSAKSTNKNKKSEEQNNHHVHTIATNKIKIGKYQPRQVFDEDEIADLALSIKHNGIIQPLVVRKVKGNYELVAGERRLRASKVAGLTQLPVIVKNINDQDALAIALIENIQRKDLNVVEEAQCYQRLIKEFKLTHEELAKVTGKSRSHITNTLRLLKLNQDVLALLLAEHISMGHARALLPLSHDAQLSLAKDIINGKLTTSEVERRVAKLLHGKVLKRNSPKALDPKLVTFERKIAKKFGMDVKIKPGKDGKGQIIINYDSVNKLKLFV